MKQRDWKIIYSSCEGVELRALEFLYAEIGNYIQRDLGVYSLYTIPCEKGTENLPDRNAVVIGTLDGNPLLRRFIVPEEIPSHGFRISIVAHPDCAKMRLVLIAGDGPAEVLYGAVTFIDDILPETLPVDGDGVVYWGDAFKTPFPVMTYSDAPATLVRSVFTWAHPIADYEEYFRNMARMKLNRVYLWNEFAPVNAREVVDCAHTWGIEVFWGFSWGWSTNCTKANVLDLRGMSANILQEWHDVWSHLPGDGIYFQSFTETWETAISGKSIAECVTELVNYTASKILEENPNLRIVYGLHATSVMNCLPDIQKTDSRLEILWENCGGFPYKVNVPVEPMKEHPFTRTLMALNHSMGLVFKCQLMQKWTDFAHQAGPYVMGRNGHCVQKHDIAVTAPMWRHYEALWAENGKLAHDLASLVQREGGVDVELNLAAQLNGPIHWPTALTAELFWNSSRCYDDIRSRVLRKRWLV